MSAKEEWQVRHFHMVDIFSSQDEAEAFANNLPGPYLQANGQVVGTITIIKVTRHTHKRAAK